MQKGQSLTIVAFILLIIVLVVIGMATVGFATFEATNPLPEIIRALGG